MIGFNSGEVLIITGNATRDAHHIPNSEGVKIDVAVNRKEKKGDEWVDTPVYYSVAVFGKDAEFAHKHFKKGDKVMVSGQPHLRVYKKDDGSTGFAHEIKFANLWNIHNAPRTKVVELLEEYSSGSSAPF